MFWLPLIIGIVLDQVTKFFVSSRLEYLESIPVIPNFFHLTFTLNKGAAFSILQGKMIFLIIVTVFALIAIGLFIRQTPKTNKFLRFSLGMLTAGIIGNFTDRLRFGQVIDFIDFRFFPIFNIADSLIVVGIIFIAWEILLPEFKKAGIKND